MTTTIQNRVEIFLDCLPFLSEDDLIAINLEIAKALNVKRFGKQKTFREYIDSMLDADDNVGVEE